ncbi:MAG: MFS transporter, partial [Negativicutes bacterium]|nr:MFS transporter [Negativicutes bacterium]
AIFFNLFGIIGATTGAYFSGRVGVRKLAMIGYAIVAISLVVFGLKYHELATPVLAALLALVLFGHSFGPGQGMTIATLSYPTEMRGLGTGWGQGMARGASIIGFFIFPLVLAATGVSTTLLFIAIIPVIGLSACLLVKWDPLGKSIS